jgi:hypothetical protein
MLLLPSLSLYKEESQSLEDHHCSSLPSLLHFKKKKASQLQPSFKSWLATLGVKCADGLGGN